MNRLNEDSFVREYLKKARKLREDFDNSSTNNADSMGDVVDTGSNNQENEIVIDKNDEKLKEFIGNITKFVGAVRVDDKAQIVYPKDADVVLNGVITDLNNLKFQFKYNDQSGGLYIWTDAMLLTKETAEKLAKLVVVRGQWKDYWANTISQYIK